MMKNKICINLLSCLKNYNLIKKEKKKYTFPSHFLSKSREIDFWPT